MENYRKKPSNTIIAPFEVAIHNTKEDCWVSFLGKVFDVTPLIAEYQKTPLINPILAFAGKDISHWFNEENGDIIHYIHPITGARVPYCPLGRIPHVDLPTPSTEWNPAFIPWWKHDDKYLIGYLTKNVRPINIMNMLNGNLVSINVCCEDSICRISERYSIFNKNATNYSWRYCDRYLDMEATLNENGVFDERDAYVFLGLPHTLFTPTIQIFYNDSIIDHLPSDSSDEEMIF